MCFYPRYIINKRYTSYTTCKKTKHPAEYCNDFRKLYIPIGCGKCYECKRQKAQQWKVRLNEEIKDHKHAYFVTLTFSNESLIELCKVNGLQENNVNAIAAIAVRRFLERYRKKYKVSLRHWLVTELGHENTERIHLHGIVFRDDPLTNEELSALWKYGRTDTGQYCNNKTINYIVKYVTKIDPDHKKYSPIILCSAGLGKNYTQTYEAQLKYRYKPRETAEYYTLPDGNKVALPIYYRNKLYTDAERQQMWTDRLDKGDIFVNGIKIRNIDTDKAQTTYREMLKHFQEWNRSIGYGDTSNEWKEEPYNITFKMLQAARKK